MFRKTIINLKHGIGYWIARTSRAMTGWRYFATALSSILLLLLNLSAASSEEIKESPLIINGDNVEYSAENKTVNATGNIEVIYKGAKLTCNKLSVNMLNKEGVAEGNARLEDQQGVVEGEKLIYNFGNKSGYIVNANFRSNPYFGRAKKVEKVDEEEFCAKNGYFTTCDFDRPHYRFNSKRIRVFPGDKIQTRESILYLGTVPLFYLPQYNHNMKDPMMHVQMTPGHSKDWGNYMLSAWRFNFIDHVNGLGFLDYRSKFGWAEGFGLNYNSEAVGKGDLKFYYTKERIGLKDLPSAGATDEFTRYFTRFRHKWDIGEQTNFSAEFYKITDMKRKEDTSENFLRDYFFREYERDVQPLSYGLLHHSFDNSSLDLLFQIRANHWFDQVEKLPELNYNLPGWQLGESRLYFENISQAGNYNKKKPEAAAPPADNVTVCRLDTTNKIALPFKLTFLQLKPFVGSRETYYDKGANGETGIVRTIFLSGMDVSTKFYRIFDTKPNFLGLDINCIRHIITPSIAYEYRHVPTIPIANLRQIDSVDDIHRGNTASLSLSNKLQTKRQGASVDFVDLLITTDYVIKPKTGDNAILTDANNRLKTDFSDILFTYKILPYSWMRMEGTATYEHSSRDNVNFNTFSLANYDLIFDLNKNQSISLGQRYERKGTNEVTGGFKWRVSPKWSFSVYERYNLKKTDNYTKGYREQEYTLTRDLHCWEMDFTFNQKKDHGSSIFFLFRLKAFPENQFGFDQTTSTKKSGRQ